MRAFAAARQDGRVRHALPRRGRRLRRPDHPDGARAGSSPTGRPPRSRRRVGLRTIRATLPGVDLAALAALPGVTNADTPRRGRDPQLRATPTPRCARCSPALPARARHRGHRRRPRGGLPATHRRRPTSAAERHARRSPDEHRRSPTPATSCCAPFRNRRFFIFSLVFPLVMFFLLAGPNKHDHNFGGDATHHTGLFAPQYYMVGLVAFGSDGRRARRRRPHRRRAQRSAGTASCGSRRCRRARYFRTKVAHRLPDGVAQHRAAVRRRASSLGVRLPLAHWLEMTGSGPGRARPVRRAGHRARATC